jgi:hypothetical protein
VAERCITTGCAAWREDSGQHQSGHIYRMESGKPGWFFD